MSQFPMTPQQYVQWVYSPHIGVLCGEEAESSCLRNNLKFVDLLQPFCQLEDDVGISDPSGSLVTVRRLRVVLQDVAHKPTSPTVASKILSHVVSANALPAQQENGVEELITPWYEKWKEAFHQLLQPFDHEFTKHLIACIIVVSSSHGAKAGEEAQRLSQQQHQQQHQPSHQHSKYPKWFSPNILKYYLVLHDVTNTSKELGDTAYKSVSTTYSSNCCHILSVNSGRGPDCPPLPAYWTPHTLLHVAVPGYNSNSIGGSECSSSPASPTEDYLLSSPTGGAGGYHSPKHSTTPPLAEGDQAPVSPTLTHNSVSATSDHPLSPTLPAMGDGEEDVVVNVGDLFPVAGGLEDWGACLSAGDVDNIRQFLGSFVRGALVPHVERQVRYLTDVVTNRSRSKSLLSATRRWLGGTKNPSQASNTVLYSSEATELQTRRLADLAFMFCMYDVAYQSYHTAKNDFKSDQAWLYFTGAQEMAALALFMQSSTDFPKRYLESTWDMMSTVCKVNNLGIRLLLVACEILKSNNNFSDAAMYYIKLTSEDSDLLSALMLEQAASCFLRAGQLARPSFSRKFAFHMTLAAHRYSGAGQRVLSLRANTFAIKVYSKSGLMMAEDHVLYSIGKFSAQLKDYTTALSAYTHLIDARKRVTASSKQSENQQLAYFREFLALYKLVEDSHDGAVVEAVPPDGGGTDAYTGPATDGPLQQLPELPIPWLHPQESMLLLGANGSSEVGSRVDGGKPVTAASGITFSNYNVEQNESWGGLERLLIERVFGAMAKPANVQLLAPHSDNTRQTLLPVGEKCWLKLPVSNPLLLSITLREAALSYRFIPDDGSAGDMDDSVNSSTVMHSVIDCVVLNAGQRTDLIFYLCPSRLGRLLLEGVKYKLSLTPEVSTTNNTAPTSVLSANSSLITGYQNIKVKGPRLNNNLTNRSSVTYASDKRLEITVVPSQPKVGVRFTGLPSRLLCGQIVQVGVTIENEGSVPITGLNLAINDPKHIYFHSDQTNNQTSRSSTSLLTVGSKHSNITNKQSSNSSFDTVQRIDLPQVDTNTTDTSAKTCVLPVGGVLKGTLCVKGHQVPGSQHLLLVFYCHAPDGNGKNRYRLLRHQSTVVVIPSVGLSVKTFSSVSVPSAGEGTSDEGAATGMATAVNATTTTTSIADQLTTEAKLLKQSPSHAAVSSKDNTPLDTRLSCNTTKTVLHNLANICVDVSVADQAVDSPSRSFTILGISSHSTRWKLKHFSGHRGGDDSCFVLSSGETVKTLVQGYAVDDLKNTVIPAKEDYSKQSVNNSKKSISNSKKSVIIIPSMFSMVYLSNKNNSDQSPSSSSSGDFALRARADVPVLTSVAPMPSPVADCAAPEQHPALVQYNKIKQASDLDMVLTVHWKTCPTADLSLSGDATATSGGDIYGQHSVVLSSIGETVVVPASLAARPLLPAGETSKPPVRIIPVEPVVLSHIASKFAASVGIDVSGGGQVLPGGMSVAQATELAESGEMDVTADLSKEQLENCVKVTAEFQQEVHHNFGDQTLCRLPIVLLVHNTTSTPLEGMLLLNAPKSESDCLDEQQPLPAPLASTSGTLQPPPSTSASSTLRYVGVVTRSLVLPGHSQSRVQCQAIVTGSGTYTLGRLSMALKTQDNVKFNRHVVLGETVVVVDTCIR